MGVLTAATYSAAAHFSGTWHKVLLSFYLHLCSSSPLCLSLILISYSFTFSPFVSLSAFRVLDSFCFLKRTSNTQIFDQTQNKMLKCATCIRDTRISIIEQVQGHSEGALDPLNEASFHSSVYPATSFCTAWALKIKWIVTEKGNWMEFEFEVLRWHKKHRTQTQHFLKTERWGKWRGEGIDLAYSKCLSCL